MRKLLATFMLSLVLAGPARAQVARVYVASEPAPEKSLRLTWCNGDACADGRWFADAQILRIDQRLTGCEDTLAKALFDTKVAETKVAIPAWVWVLVGMAVTGGAWYTVEAMR
jgi:hypothetical protein